jgi:XTP/dITP diphosphohydrolase
VMSLNAAGLAECSEEAQIERFDTFEANALAKAQYFFARSGRIPTVADDSGLEVAGLGGRPGPRSKRWSGRADLTGRALDAANNEALLAALAPDADRSARYVCVAAYVDEGRARVYRGEVAGRILTAPRGTEGFGYDPIFESAELGATFAEVDPAARARVSHRARAFRALLANLRRSG